MPSAGKRTVNCKSFNFLIVTKIMLSNLKKYQLIFASNSPRRKELMSGLGVEYVVRTLPDVDESYPETLVGAAIPARKSTRLNSSHTQKSRMPSSA